MTIKGLLILALYIAFLVGCAYLGKHYVRPLVDKLRYKHDKALVEADYLADRYYNQLYNEAAEEALAHQMHETARMMQDRE